MPRARRQFKLDHGKLHKDGSEQRRADIKASTTFAGCRASKVLPASTPTTRMSVLTKTDTAMPKVATMLLWSPRFNAGHLLGYDMTGMRRLEILPEMKAMYVPAPIMGSKK